MSKSGKTKQINSSFGVFIQKYALVGALFVVLLVFTLMRPNSFLTQGNIRSLLTSQAVTIILAYAVMIPLATNEFDLSVGYLAGTAQVLVIGLQVNNGFNWWSAVLVALLVGSVAGLLNGILITQFGISSFIATLATGMILFGITNWFTKGQQILGSNLPTTFTNLVSAWGFIPIPAIIFLTVGVIIYYFLQRTVPGRSLFVVGASRRAAELTGISVRRSLITAFVMSGFLAAIAGTILGANLRTATASTGPEFLLPAFAGAMLGATSITPGRVNIGGTLIASLTLAFLFSGVQQLGAPYYTQYFFQGGILIIAVALSVYAAKKQKSQKK